MPQYNRARDRLLIALASTDEAEALAALRSARSDPGLPALQHELEALSSAEFAHLEAQFDEVYAKRTDNADGTDGDYPHMPGKYDHSSNKRANPDDILKGNGLDQFPGTKVTFLMDGKTSNAGDSPNDPALSNMQDVNQDRTSDPNDVALEDTVGDGNSATSSAPGEFNYALDGNENNGLDVNDFQAAETLPTIEDIEDEDDLLNQRDIPLDDDEDDEEEDASTEEEAGEKKSWSELEGRPDEELVNPQLADCDDTRVHAASDDGDDEDEDDIDEEDDEILSASDDEYHVFGDDNDGLLDIDDAMEGDDGEFDDDDGDYEEEDEEYASVSLPDAPLYPVESNEDMPVKIWDRGEQVSDIDNDGDDDVGADVPTEASVLADTDTTGDEDSLDTYVSDVHSSLPAPVPGEYWYKHRAVEDAQYHLQEQKRHERMASTFSTLHDHAKTNGNVPDSRDFHKQYEHAKRWAGLHGNYAQELLRQAGERRKQTKLPHDL